MGEGCESARNAQVVDSRPPAATAIGGNPTTRGGLHGRWRVKVIYVEEAYVRLIPSLFMRCLRVPGFNPSRTAAPSLPSITQ